jgi:group I intron endonuclease
MIGIYKITSPTKKVYIGQSVNVEKRFKEYTKLSCKSQTRLYNSFKKHKFKILCECEMSELNDKERYYQDLYSAIGITGMNCKLTTTKDRSGKLSIESIEKRIKKITGKKHSQETKDKIRLSNIGKNLGKKKSTETRQKISLSNTGKKRNLESTEKQKLTMSILYKKGYVNPNTGKRHSEESILKMRVSAKKRGYSENYIKSVSKIVLDNSTGIFYNSCLEASKCFNLKYGTLISKLNGNRKNNTNLIYV